MDKNMPLLAKDKSLRSILLNIIKLLETGYIQEARKQAEMLQMYDWTQDMITADKVQELITVHGKAAAKPLYQVLGLLSIATLAESMGGAMRVTGDRDAKRLRRKKGEGRVGGE